MVKKKKDKMSNGYISIVKLNNNKYFIAHTQFDIQLYLSDFKRKILMIPWVFVNKPIGVIRTFECSRDYLNYHILQYMQLKGIHNVRGGGYSDINLSRAQLRTIQQCVQDI